MNEHTLTTARSWIVECISFCVSSCESASRARDATKNGGLHIKMLPHSASSGEKLVNMWTGKQAAAVAGYWSSYLTFVEISSVALSCLTGRTRSWTSAPSKVLNCIDLLDQIHVRQDWCIDKFVIFRVIESVVFALYTNTLSNSNVTQPLILHLVCSRCTRAVKCVFFVMWCWTALSHCFS